MQTNTTLKLSDSFNCNTNESFKLKIVCIILPMACTVVKGEIKEKASLRLHLKNKLKNKQVFCIKIFNNNNNRTARPIHFSL